MGFHRRKLLLLASAALVCSSSSPVAAEDRVVRLITELRQARSFKVRVQAAYLLAKVHDPRVLPALTAALAGDKDEVVREFSARLVGNNPGGDLHGHMARVALAKALHDPVDSVRRSAKNALAALDAALRASVRQHVSAMPPARASGRIKIAVGQVADRSGHATGALRQRARLELINQLTAQPRVQVTDHIESDVGFVVDGSIRKLTLLSLRADVEATCVIELILSRPERGIMMVASGEASVQKARGHFRPQHRAALQEDAVANAVRSAHDNLASFLAKQ